MKIILLEEWLIQKINRLESITYLYNHLYDRDILAYKEVLHKLQKLKGSDNQ